MELRTGPAVVRVVAVLAIAAAAARVQRAFPIHPLPPPDRTPPLMQAQYGELTTSNDFLGADLAVINPFGLRQRYAVNGYVYLKEAIPRSEVLGLRRELAELLRKHGWTDRDQPDPLGTRSTGIPARSESADDPLYWPYYDAVLKLPRFHELPHTPAVLAVLEALYGERAFPHPRKIGRVLFPGSDQYRYPPHQDWVFVQGEPADSSIFATTVTGWIPLGDVPREMGGLCVLEGGHANLLPVVPIRGSDGIPTAGVDTAELEQHHRWKTADFAAGDILLISSRTPHRGGENRAGDLRLSIDARYNPISTAVTDGPLEVHWRRMAWDDVYRDWPVDHPLRFYWRNETLTVVPFDPDANPAAITDVTARTNSNSNTNTNTNTNTNSRPPPRAPSAAPGA